MSAAAELCTCTAIRQAERHIARHYARAFAPFGLTIDQFATMAKLHRLGPATIPGLAERMVMDRAMLHYTLKEPIARGLVAVHRDARDGRCRIVALTEAGTAFFLQAKASWQAVNAQIDAALGDGAPALRDLLKAVEGLDLRSAAPEDGALAAAE
jgi:DNA-binding MarR family transcriptional regulator